MKILVNGESKEPTAIHDSFGADITEEFLKSIVNNVARYYRQREAESDKKMIFKPYLKYEDLPSTSMLPELPPPKIDAEIRYDPRTDRIEMTQEAFEWLQLYAPKHNEVSKLENRLLAHIRASDLITDYEKTGSYKMNKSECLDDAAKFQSEWLRKFAAEKGIDIGDIQRASNLPEYESAEAQPDDEDCGEDFEM